MPSVTVNIVDGALSDGDSSSVVTFTFSRGAGRSFTEADIQVSAGLTLNAGSLSMIDATHYQATFTADDGFTGTGTVSLAAGSCTDAALNLGGAGSDSVAIDRQNPTMTVDLVDGALSDGDSSSVVTFTFSEAPGQASREADIQASAGLTLDAGSLSMIDATHYQATVTADDSFTGTGTVSLAAGSYTDAALNLGGAGSDSVPIDTAEPDGGGRHRRRRAQRRGQQLGGDLHLLRGAGGKLHRSRHPGLGRPDAQGRLAVDDRRHPLPGDRHCR